MLEIQEESNRVVEKQGLPHELRTESKKLIDKRKTEKIDINLYPKRKRGCDQASVMLRVYYF